MRRFIRFHDMRHPAEMGAEEMRARKSAHLPVVMTRAEVRAVLAELEGEYWLISALRYGTGMRLTECLSLRVQDIDFGANQIVVRDGKGGTDRVTMLPESHNRRARPTSHT